MPSYAVDGARTALLGTGIVKAVKVWEEVDGRRRPTGGQARDEDTGMPLWQVEVMYQQSAYGEVTTVTGTVTVPADVQPEVAAVSPVRFEGLAVEVRVNRRSGALVEVWSADALTDVSPAASTPTTGTGAGSGAAGTSGSKTSGGKAAA